MQKFTTYEEYKDLTKGFRKAHAPLDSNLFLLPDELKSTIAEGRMSYTLTDDALLLYVDEGYYYHLYYFLPLSSELPEIRLDKQVLVEIIYNEKRENETVQALRDKCLRAGAHYKKKSRQMEMPLSRMREVLDSDYEAVESRLKSEGISFSFAEKKDLPKSKASGNSFWTLWTLSICLCPSWKKWRKTTKSPLPETNRARLSPENVSRFPAAAASPIILP